jgi:hypothetical protein
LSGLVRTATWEEYYERFAEKKDLSMIDIMKQGMKTHYLVQPREYVQKASDDWLDDFEDVNSKREKTNKNQQEQKQ